MEEQLLEQVLTSQIEILKELKDIQESLKIVLEEVTHIDNL